MSALPNGWERTTTSEVCALVQSGGTPKGGFSDQPDIPFLKVYNITSQRVDFDYRPQFVSDIVHRTELGKSIVLPGDVLMNIVGPPLGKAAIVPSTYPQWNINQALTAFRSSAAVSSEWLYFFLCGGSSVRSVINETRGSAGQVNISLSQCRNFEIPVPPAEEQRRIVAKIESLTSKFKRARDHLDHIPRLVEKYKQAVLAAAFKSDGGIPTQLGHLALPSAPIHYGVVQPGTVKDVGVPMIRVCDLHDGHVAWSELRRISPAIDNQFSGARVQNGDVLITVVGTIGRVAVVSGMTEQTNIARAVARIRPDPSKVLPSWLGLRLENDDCQRSFALDAREVARKTLNISLVKTLPIKVPSLSKQAETVRKIQHAVDWIDRLCSEATSARRLIDHLDQAVLTKAFRGELVPQDPSHEPARVLLERVRAERGAAPNAQRGRKA